MADITYTAEREIASGHTQGTQYTITIPLARWDRSPRTEKNTVRSLSGRTMTRRLNTVVFYDITTSPTDDATQIAHMREFLASVNGGETFTINPFGGGAISLKLDGDHREGRQGTTDFISFAFKVYEV